MIMAAVAETAAPDIRMKLSETPFQLPGVHVAQPKTANSGRVNELTALGHTVERGCGSGMPTHTRCFRQAACLNIDVG